MDLNGMDVCRNSPESFRSRFFNQFERGFLEFLKSFMAFVEQEGGDSDVYEQKNASAPCG
jgi:hypothetical protein